MGIDRTDSFLFKKNMGHRESYDFKKIDEPKNRNEEVFNMAIRYLENINLLILNYIEFGYNDDYEKMYQTLEWWEALLSPKVDNDDVERQLDWLRRNLHAWKRRDEYGKMIGIYPERLERMKYLLNDTFKKLLSKMENRNLLSPKVMKPEDAVKEFE